MGRMATPRRNRIRAEAARRAAGMSRSIGETLRISREDAGLPQRIVADAAGISQSHYAAIENGTTEPSLETICAVSLALGGEASLRFFPGTGPRLRDRTQAAMVEAFLRAADRRWSRFVEVPVYRPATGVIDLVLADPSVGLIVAAEFQSQLRRLEQQLRWARVKADSLPSTSVGVLADAEPAAISRLLVLRSTREMRALATEFEQTLASAYPARTREVFAAVTNGEEWPGPGVLWMVVDGARTRLIDGPPRGVGLGR